MRIHEVLETCIEYVVCDGVLGSDVFSLQQHLAKSDPSVDREYFAHIFSLLSTHSAIQIITTKHPLTSENGFLQLGSEPLPADFDVQAAAADSNLNVDELYHQGIRGRQLAFKLAGQDYRTNKETVLENREIRRQQALKTTAVVDENGAGPSTPRADPVALFNFISGKEGFEDLVEKWGSRLRIRAVDDEIYHRLTGSHQKVPKITPVVFHILQLAAKAREKGITAIELGPAVGSSQGSLHYYMKVLGQLGLTAKVPAIIHGAVTNLLLFHRFLDQNETYRSMMKLPPLLKAEECNLPDDDAGEAADDADDDAASGIGRAWDFDFPPLTEGELMAGHIVKERMIKILDHPSLVNHLLKNKNLLALIGWKRQTVTRHRRAVPRHIESLVLDEIVEVIAVGEKKISCLRLTKYNPDFKHKAVVETPIQTIIRPSDSDIMQHHTGDFTHQEGLSSVVTMEYQTSKHIVNSGLEGMTIADVREHLDAAFKRTVEFYFVRSDTAFVPPELRHMAIATLMESHGRERRLRAFSLSSYRELMVSQGQDVSVLKHPPVTSAAGHWADISYRRFYDTPRDIWPQLDIWATGDDKAFESGITHAGGAPRLRPLDIFDPEAAGDDSEGKGKIMERRKGKSKTATKGDATSDAEDDLGEGSSRQQPKKAREPKDKTINRYPNEVQARGRPRKYIQVVEETGKVNRTIIGSVYPAPELAPIYVLHRPTGTLVVAPRGYSGVGVPPPLDPKSIAEGRIPEYFASFPNNNDPNKKRAGPSKQKQKEQKDAEQARAKQEKEEAKRQKAAEREKRKAEETEPAPPKKKGRPRKHPLPESEIASSTQPGPSGTQQETGQREAGSQVPDGIVIDPALLDEEVPELPGGPRADRDVTEVDGRGDVNLALELAGQADSSEPSLRHLDTGPSSRAHIPEVTHTGQEQVSIDDQPQAGPSQPGPSVDSTSTTVPVTDGSPAPAARQRKRKLAPQTPEVSSDAPAQKRIPRKSETGSTRKLPKIAPATARPPTPSPPPPEPPVPEMPKRQRPHRSIAVDNTDSATLLRPLQRNSVLSRMMKESASTAQPVNGETEPTEVEKVSDPLVEVTNRQATPSTGPPPSTPLRSPTIGAHQATSSPVPDAHRGIESDRVISQPTAQGDGVQGHAPPQVMQEANSQREPLPGHATPPTSSSPIPVVMARPTAPSVPEAVSTPALGSAAQVRTRHISRLDLGQIRRQNEVLQTLKDLGGVLTEHKLRTEHYEWTKRVAGTDWPFAPAIASQMDRTVFKRAINALLRDSRLKETVATTPTTTGRWVKTTVYYLVDADPHAVQGYIRDLGTQISAQLSLPKRSARPGIAQTQFTEIRLPVPGAKFKPRISVSASIRDTPCVDEVVNPADRRATLIQEHRVVASLYGYVPGRAARVATFHKAIISAIERSAHSEHLTVASPRVIAVPLLFNEVTIAEWYSFIAIKQYDEELESYLSDPIKRQTLLKDLPKHLNPGKGFGGHKSKSKLAGLLSALNEMRLIDPLRMTASDATCTYKDKDDLPVSFTEAESTQEAIYFRIYEYAPIYHIAAQSSGLLGVMPVITLEQTVKFWSTFKSASVYADINRVPRIPRSSTTEGLMAPLTDLLAVSSPTRQTFHSRARWREVADLNDVQSDALDSFTSNSQVHSDAEIDAFAWEYAIPRDVVSKHLQDHRATVQARGSRYKELARAQQEARAAAEKQRKAGESLHQKIAEFRASSKAEWEARVGAAAGRVRIDFSPALLEFLGRYAVQKTNRVGPISNDELDEGCRAFVRRQEYGDLAAPEQGRPLAIRKLPMARRSRKKETPKRDSNLRTTRNRRAWSTEDDDMLVDCEAIIRARSGQGNPSGRPAMLQIFPDVRLPAIWLRLKKVLTDQPGRQSYLERLTEAWSKLWQEKRGTEELPDEHPNSNTEFDLRAHLVYLRQNISKQSLISNVRVDTGIDNLPADINVMLSKSWSIPAAKNNSESYWEGLGDEPRLIAQSACPILEPDIEFPDSASNAIKEGKLQAILKIIVGTPVDAYEEPVATNLLKPYQNSVVSATVKAMSDDKILTRTRGSIDGRGLAFSHGWSTLGDGPLLPELEQEASALIAKFDETEALDWSLMAGNGDMAALCQMTSNHEVDFDIDPSTFPTNVYYTETYNTRKLHDDDFEFDVKVRKAKSIEKHATVPAPSLIALPQLKPWTTTAADPTLVARIVELVKQAGSSGITKPSLRDLLDVSPSSLSKGVAALASQTEPPVFWTGYDTATLVSTSFVDAWTMPTPSGARARPRKWSDIRGNMLLPEWERSRSGVLNTIIGRAGLTEFNLRARMRPALDRLEVTDILQHLLDEGLIERRLMDPWAALELPPVEATDVSEEKLIILGPSNNSLWK